MSGIAFDRIYRTMLRSSCQRAAGTKVNSSLKQFRVVGAQNAADLLEEISLQQLVLRVSRDHMAIIFDAV
jgi:hypothetical protein